MTGPGWSLRSRLQRRTLAAVAMGWLAGLVIGAVVIAHEMDELVDHTLAAEARLLAAALPAGTAPGLRDDGGLTVRIAAGPADGSAQAPWPPLAADGASRQGGWHLHRASNPATGLVVEVGQPQSQRRKEIREAAQALLLLMLPTLALVLWVTRRTVDGALVPALGFAARLRDRAAGDPAPMVEPGLPRELMAIPAALNGYLQRIDSLLAAERAFAANAAHELRTPLASAMAQAQLIASGQGDAGAAARLHGALARLAQMTERLLELARAEAGTAPAGQCDLVTVGALVVRELGAGRIVFDDGDLETLPAPVDADMAAIMLGNLLRNALDHGSGPVTLRLRPGPVAIVENPVAPGAAFRPGRFEKGAASRGFGLGMVIVEALARAHGVTASFEMGDRSARVELRFCGAPAAPAPA